MRFICIALLFVFVSPMASAGEGYDAGYRWAANKGIDDPSYCYSRSGGYINNSPSFTQGCLDYLVDEGVIDEDEELVDEDEEE